MIFFDFLQRCHDSAIRFSLLGEELKVSAPKNTLSPEVVAQLRQFKPELMAWLRENGGAGASHASVARLAPMTKQASAAMVSASPGQQQLWLTQQAGASGDQYHFVCVLDLQGQLNVSALETAFASIVERHEPLRTVFAEVNGEVQQCVMQHAVCPVVLSDLTALPEAERLERCAELESHLAGAPFDLARDVMLRLHLIALGEQHHRLCLVLHHIASDGWSLGVLIKEFQALYAAGDLAGNQGAALPPLPVRYTDYTYWLRQSLQGQLGADLKTYWTERLRNAPQMHSLATDHHRARVPSSRAAHLHTTLGGDTLHALRQLAQQTGTTLFMVLETVFSIVLRRHGQSDDMIIGTPVANRMHDDVAGLVGYFVNLVALRHQVDPSLSFTELLRQAREQIIGAFAHQMLPFDEVVRSVLASRSTSHGALVQVVFTLQNNAIDQLALRELTCRIERPDKAHTFFDITLEATDTNAALALHWEYSSDLFDAVTIARMAGHFNNLLHCVVADPSAPIGQLAMLPDAERHYLLHTLNDSAADYPRHACVHELFEVQVQRAPAQVAVVCDNTSLTYAQLNERANQLAHYLRAQGVAPGTLVGLCLERSVEMVVALLAVNKTGGAYVPLDPAYPQQRLDHMLDDARPVVLITHSALAGVVSPHTVPTFCLDLGAATLAQYATGNTAIDATSERLAYVIYTSGSTGKPKGVAIAHRALTNFICSMQKEPGITARDVMINVTSLSFDIAALELYLPLVCGARLIVCSREAASDPRQLAQLMARHAVSMMQATPSTWRMLVDTAWPQLPHPLKVLCGGEALSATLAQEILRHAPAIWNMYGPTETTIWSTLRCLTAAPASPPIGRPIANTQLYILDSCMQLVPHGASGELYIGGDGLATGYLNRPHLSAERFVSHPFAPSPARLYRTGDLVRYLANGDLDYLGRIDDQVKVRGYRIELGEIEHHLAQHASVALAVVLAREDQAGDKRLVAYVSAADGSQPDQARLRAHLQASLPEFMLPAMYVVLDGFPLTPNGKIDKRALPAPDSNVLATAYVAPRTDTEVALAAIWAAVLKVDQVGTADNFFSLGGHSLLAVQLQGRVGSVFNKEIKLKDVFEHPTVASMAKRLDALALRVATPVRRLGEKDYYHTSFKQKAEWVHNQINAALGNSSWSYQYRTEVPHFRLPLIEQTMTLLIARHETLRTTFHVIDAALRQKVHPASAYALATDVIDLSHLADATPELDAIEQRDSGHNFDFAALHQFLLRIVKTRAGYWLIFTIDHALADRQFIFSMQSDFSQIYKSLLQNSTPQLPPIEVTYKDYAEWEYEEIDGQRGAEHRAYWHGLIGNGPHLTLSRQIADYPLPLVYSYSDYIAQNLAQLPATLDPFLQSSVYGAILGIGNSDASTRVTRRYVFPIRDADYAALQATVVATNTPLSALMLAALSILLHRLTQAVQVNIISHSGTPVSERWLQAGGHTGNDIVAVANFSDAMTIDELVRATRTQMLESDEHKIYPLARLLHELDVSHDALGAARFNFVSDFSADQLPLTGWGHEQADTFGFDLELACRGYRNGLYVVCDYRRDLFEANTIELMMDKLLRIARKIGQADRGRIDVIDLDGAPAPNNFITSP